MTMTGSPPYSWGVQDGKKNSLLLPTHTTAATARPTIAHTQLRHLLSCPQRRGLVYYVEKSSILECDLLDPQLPHRCVTELDFAPTCFAATALPSNPNMVLFAAGGYHSDISLSLHHVPPAATSKLIWKYSRHHRGQHEIVNYMCFSLASLTDDVRHKASTDIRLIVCGNDMSVRFFDVALQTNVRDEDRLQPCGSVRLDTCINHASLSPDGHTLLCVGDTPKAYLFGISPGTPLKFFLLATYTLPDPPSSFLAPSPLPPVRTLPPDFRSHACFATAWSADGLKFTVASQEGQLCVWDVRSAVPLFTYWTPFRRNSHRTHLQRPRGGEWEWEDLGTRGSPIYFEEPDLTNNGPDSGIRNVRFSAGEGGRELLVFAEHTTNLHVIDARTFDPATHSVIPFPDLSQNTTAPHTISPHQIPSILMHSVTTAAAAAVAINNNNGSGVTRSPHQIPAHIDGPQWYNPRSVPSPPLSSSSPSTSSMAVVPVMRPPQQLDVNGSTSLPADNVRAPLPAAPGNVRPNSILSPASQDVMQDARPSPLPDIPSLSRLDNTYFSPSRSPGVETSGEAESIDTGPTQSDGHSNRDSNRAHSRPPARDGGEQTPDHTTVAPSRVTVVDDTFYVLPPLLPTTSAHSQVSDVVRSNSSPLPPHIVEVDIDSATSALVSEGRVRAGTSTSAEAGNNADVNVTAADSDSDAGSLMELERDLQVALSAALRNEGVQHPAPRAPRDFPGVGESWLLPRPGSEWRSDSAGVTRGSEEHERGAADNNASRERNPRDETTERMPRLRDEGNAEGGSERLLGLVQAQRALAAARAQGRGRINVGTLRLRDRINADGDLISPNRGEEREEEAVRTVTLNISQSHGDGELLRSRRRQPRSASRQVSSPPPAPVLPHVQLHSRSDEHVSTAYSRPYFHSPNPPPPQTVHTPTPPLSHAPLTPPHLQARPPVSPPGSLPQQGAVGQPLVSVSESLETDPSTITASPLAPTSEPVHIAGMCFDPTGGWVYIAGTGGIVEWRVREREEGRVCWGGGAWA